MDTSYILRKLAEGYMKLGLEINETKTEYLVVSDVGQDLELDTAGIRGTSNLKYLEATSFRSNNI